MPVRKNKESEYKAWARAMLEKNMRPIVRLAAWFFNLIDSGKLDIKSIIYTFCHTGELYEMFGISESAKWKIFFSVKAIVEYHDRGEEFRLAWNFYWLKNDALIIEAIKKTDEKRYIFNPYIK
ncbi:MAG: hypothetical protein AAB621_02560 [Patescibacteria group bacterium]